MVLLVDSVSDTDFDPPSEPDPPRSGAGDRELWTSVARGDLGAFEAVVRRHQASLVRFLERLVGNRADAEDVAQETFLGALRRAGAFQGRASLRSWLFAIAKNEARAFFRSKLRRRRRERVAGAATEIRQDNSSDEWLRRLCDELPPKLREALFLCDVHGFTYEEAAEVLGCPVKTVSTRLFRARERMAGFLRDRDLK